MAEVPNGRRVTSVDVAREAGVSRTTVSYVLNDTPHQTIPDTTRRRVLDAAVRLGYAPSPAARTLRAGRSDIVLGLLPDWPIGPVLGQMVQCLTTAFAEHELTFVVHSSTRAARPLGEIWKALTPAAVLALSEFSEVEAAEMRRAGIEVIMAMHGTVHGRSRAPLVTQNPIGALQARYLVDAGHRRLGYACPVPESLDILVDQRLDGVRKACAERGLPEPDVRTVPLRLPEAAEVVRTWHSADPPVTGVCAFNDDVAMAVLAGLAHLGLRCPQDMAVIGVDDIYSAAVAHPPLTTVVRDIDHTTRSMARRVVDALAGKEIPTEPIRDELRVVARESA